MFTLSKWADALPAGASAESHDPPQHSIVYVAQGSVDLDGQHLDEGEASYREGSFQLDAGANGALLWRWGLSPVGSGDGLLISDAAVSIQRMVRRVKMFEMVPTSKWLFRLDRILNFEGTTGMHSHPGSGIRCMQQGTLRAESQKGECSYASQSGDVWYEEGAYPLVSTVDPGDKATFLRGMILPPEFKGFPDTAVWIEGFKATYDGSTVLQDVVVTLR